MPFRRRCDRGKLQGGIYLVCFDLGRGFMSDMYGLIFFLEKKMYSPVAHLN